MPVRPRSWIALALLAAGCAATPDARPLDLKPGATYTSRPGNFTAVVPPLLGPGVHESDATADDGTTAAVTFADDFGILLDVRSRQIAKTDPRIDSRSGNRELADRYLDDTVLPTLRGISPGLTVVHADGHVETPAGAARFAVVRLPGGSARTLHTVTGDAYHPDAVRGILTFTQLGWVYAVSVQQWPATPNQPPMTDADRDQRLLADLRQAVGEMTFH